MSTPTTTSASDPAAPSAFRQLLWMFSFLRPVAGVAVRTCLYLALMTGAEVLAVLQSGRAVDQIQHLHLSNLATQQGFLAWAGSAEPEAVRLRQTCLLFALFVFLAGGLRYFREVAATRTSMRMVFHMRQAIYDKLQRVGFAFHDRISTGQLINRALTDLQNVRAFIQSAVLVSLEIVLVVGGYIGLILWRSPSSPWIVMLSLAPLPVWCWYILSFGKKVMPASRSVMESGDHDVSLITENISGVHVVRAFATEQQEIRKYTAHTHDYFKRVIGRIRMYANFMPMIRAIGMASHLMLFLAVALLMIRGHLDAGDFIILGSAMGAILSRLQMISVIAEQYQNAAVSCRRLHEVLYADSTVPERPDAPDLPPGPGAVRFEQVEFGYVPDKPVLHAVSLDVPAGARVAIVGPTGAGKTTLVNLLARFYDPQHGCIRLDGVDLRQVKLASLRAQIGFVFQETYLFSDTIAANIAYGRPGITAGEIEAAARLAQAHEFIEQLPQGYQTVLGERGQSLSGGQRQRLAIARAIVTNPRILVLDDATAALDAETEDLIRRALNVVMNQRTTFIIAHRISTARQADLVVVLENGRVTQTGTHAQLMREDGHYRQIARAQLHGEPFAPAPQPEEPPSHMDRVAQDLSH